MTDVPAETPVAMPVLLPIVATEVVPLDHVPPGVTSASVVVSPWQTAKVPVIAAGRGFTVTIVVAIQPVLSV